MIILDTNVLSAVMQTVPDERVVAWLGLQPRESVWTTAITIFEVRMGLSLLPLGRRRTHLETTFAKVVSEDLDGRVLPFDVVAAERAGELAAARQNSGINIAERDTQIAGITLARGATLATRNIKDFADLEPRIINPWLDQRA